VWLARPAAAPVTVDVTPQQLEVADFVFESRAG